MKALDFPFEKQCSATIHNRTPLQECELKLSGAESYLDLLSKCRKEVQRQFPKLKGAKSRAERQYRYEHNHLNRFLQVYTAELQGLHRDYNQLFQIDIDLLLGGIEHPRARDILQNSRNGSRGRMMSMIEGKRRSIDSLNLRMGFHGDNWR